MYRPGKDNGGADALSCNPLPFDGEVDDQLQVAQVRTTEWLVEIPSLMELEPSSPSYCDFDREQRQDPDLNTVIQYLGQRATSRREGRQANCVACCSILHGQCNLVLRGPHRLAAQVR